MTSSSISKQSDRLSAARIRLARERRGLTKAAMAEALGVTARAVQNYEADGAPRDRAQALAGVLRVREGFFDLPALASIDSEQGFFRARRRASATQLTSARAAASIGREAYEWIAARFQLPAVDVPDLDGMFGAEAALTLRAVWGRNEGPLPNLVQLAESHGVRVMSLPPGPDVVDAFSAWLDGVPYVFLSTSKTAERSRFDLAHELGHLVMHSRREATEVDGGQRSSSLEREADEFASAFLMPARDVLAHSGQEPAVRQILELRDYYRVSALAMTRRLFDLGRLRDWSYRQNCITLSQRGYRSTEPGGIRRERSRVFDVVFAQLRSGGTKPAAMCAELGIEIIDLHDMTFGQVPIPVDGGQQGSSADVPHLRLVR